MHLAIQKLHDAIANQAPMSTDMALACTLALTPRLHVPGYTIHLAIQTLHDAIANQAPMSADMAFACALALTACRMLHR
jgi:hypothetical protein